MVEITITRNNAVTILCMVIILAIVWMVIQSRSNAQQQQYIYSKYEGFTSSSSDLANYGYTIDELDGNNSDNGNKRELFSNSASSEPRKKSKLSTLMKNKRKISSRYPNNNKSNAQNSGKRDKEAYTNVLKWLDDDDEDSDKEGKYDNFQDVLDEIDKIDVSAFGIHSMGNTISRYSKNIDNRMKYAHKKNKNSRLDANMAQLGVLTEEFRKLFAIDKLL